MPWLVATAFLHSVMIQERRDMLKIWNVSLIVFTFVLTIFGTFITRSGIIASVHSFGQSQLGFLFLGFLGLIIFFSFYLIYTRRKDLKSRYLLDSILSRESSFLFNNLILLGAVFAILWGTLFPMISEAVRGTKITVGAPFFNTITVPIGIALILLTGICPLISWRKTSISNFTKNFLIPSAVFVVAFIILFTAGIRDFYSLMAISLSIFVISTIVLEFYRGIAARMKYNNENLFNGLKNLVFKYRRRYGGYLIHIGMMIIFIGITGATVFKVEKEKVLRKGDSMTIRNYKLTFLGSDDFKTPLAEKFIATLRIEKDGKNIGIATPSKEYYYLQKQTSTEVSITSSFKEDLYIILAGGDDSGAVNIKAKINPLIGWIWWGGYILFAATIFTMWPSKKKNKKKPVQKAKNEKENTNELESKIKVQV